MSATGLIRLFRSSVNPVRGIGLLAFYLLFAGPPAVAQEGGNTPESLSFNEIKAQGGGVFTGDLSLSIPLLSVPGPNGFEFPIVLSYSSGIRAQQLSSWVGLGFNLHVGSISRTVVNRVDEQHACMFITGHCSSPLGDFDLHGPVSTVTTADDELGGILRGDPEFEGVDTYLAHFSEGTYAITPVPQPHVSSDHVKFVPTRWQPWQIDFCMKAGCVGPMPNRTEGATGSVLDFISEFKITREDGTIYVFDKPRDLKLNGSGYPYKIEFPNRWDLTRVQAPFSDEAFDITYRSFGQDDYFEAPAVGSSDLGLGSRAVFGQSGGSTIPAQLTYQYSYVASITSSTHIAEFITSQKGTGLDGNLYRLNEIRLKERSTGAYVKKIKFTYALFPNDCDASWEANETLKGNDLTLLSIREFEYKNGNPSPKPATRFEYVDPNPCTEGQPSYFWSLKKITYPEGGTVKYTYEHDTHRWFYDFIGEACSQDVTCFRRDPVAWVTNGRLKKVVVDDGLGTIRKTKYVYGEGVLNTRQASSDRDFRSNMGTTARDGVGYRWVRTDYLNASNGVLGSVKRWFTSAVSEQGEVELGGALPDPPVVPGEALPPGFVGGEWTSYEPLHGQVWKEEYLDADTTTIVRLVEIDRRDKAGALNFYDAHTGRLMISSWRPDAICGDCGRRIGSHSYWAPAKEQRTQQDGVTQKRVFVYTSDNITLNTFDSGQSDWENARPFNILEFDDQGSPHRVFRTVHAYKVYPAMRDSNMLVQSYSRKTKAVAGSIYPISDTAGVVEAMNWTLWDDANATGRYLPDEEWVLKSEHGLPAVDCTVAGGPDGGGCVNFDLLVKTASYDLYDTFGNLVQSTDAQGVPTTTKWGPRGLVPLATVRNATDAEVGFDASGQVTYPADALATQTVYDPVTLQPVRIVDEAGVVTRYEYDNLNRLRDSYRATSGGEDHIASYAYHYSRNSNANGDFDPTNPNAITTTRYRASGCGGGGCTWEKQFFDGLGRLMQTQVRDGNDYVVSMRQYDARGRVASTWKPIPSPTNGSFMLPISFTLAAFDYYDGAPGPDAGGRPYRETRYDHDALNRLRVLLPEGTNDETEGVNTAYGAEVPPGGNTTFAYTQTRDEEQKISRTYRDALGNVRFRVAGYGTPEQATTQFDYNVLDQTTQVLSPAGYPTFYKYNTRGELLAKTTPDADGDGDQDPTNTDEVDYRYAYDVRGNLRFVEDPAHRGDGYDYTVYDTFGRAIETGFCEGGDFDTDPVDPADSDDPDNTCTMGSGTRTKRETQRYTYDVIPTGKPLGMPINNPRGHLTQVIFDGGYYQYSYDTEGFLEALYVKLDGMTEGRLIAYEYDLQGNISAINFAQGHATDALVLTYTYDELGRLKDVFSRTGSDSLSVREALYSYWPTHQVKQLQLGNGTIPPVDYRYHVRDWLTRINDPFDPGADPFALSLGYEKNGNVQSMGWTTRSNTVFGDHVQYDYTYDALNRLRSADFCRWDSGICASETAYDVGFDAGGSLAGIQYDANGNITGLQRWGVDNKMPPQPVYRYLGYTYTNGHPASNRLQQVTIDTTSYDFAYDANGNMTQSRVSDSSRVIAYDRRNLPALVPLPGGSTLLFRYDSDGQRIYKKLVDAAGNLVRETFYLRGVDGRVLAVYSNETQGQSPRLAYWNILSGGVAIGRIAPPQE